MSKLTRRAVAGFLLLALAGTVSAEPNLPRARNRIEEAEMLIGQEELGSARGKLREAEDFLEGATGGDAAPLVAKIAELRAKLSPKPATPAAPAAAAPAKNGDLSEEGQNVVRYLDVDLSPAENEITVNYNRSLDSLKSATRRLNSDQTREHLDPVTIKAYRERITQVQAKVDAFIKKDVLSRAEDPMKELEEKLRADPYKGLDQRAANRVSTDLEYLVKRVDVQLERLSSGDKDVQAYYTRLSTAKKKMAAADAAWGKSADLEQLADRWKYYKKTFEGWADQKPDASPFAVKPWATQGAVQVIAGVNYLLAEKEVKEMIAKYKDEDEVKGLVAEAQKLRDAAAEKLNTAFNASFEAAEKAPLSEREYDMALPKMMADEAGKVFEGTKFKEANVSRAMKLDAKWKAEVKRLEGEAAAEMKRMNAEADVAWPKIVASLKPQDGFAANKVNSFKGKTVIFRGIRNRSGWDFDGEFGLVFWLNGVPVAAHYDDQTIKLFRETGRKIRGSVSEYVDWDVVAVVEGTGLVNQRIITTIIDKNTRDELGKVDVYKPIDGVRIRIVAMRAGPLVIAPK